MTGKEIIEFIQKHKLEEIDFNEDSDSFDVDLTDGRWAEYDIFNEAGVLVFPDPNANFTPPVGMTFDDVMKLRADLKKENR